MHSSDGSQSDGDEQQPNWVDLSKAPLSWFFSTDDAALARCVREVMAELDQPQQILAAFGNCPSP